MTDNQKKKLGELKIELDAYVLMSQLVFSISHDEGDWKKANKKWPHSDNVVYWNDAEGYGILSDGEDGNFKAFNYDTDFVCPITLPKFVEVIKELAPKPKAKKAKKKPVTYMDVFDRVLDIMNDKTGFAPDDVESEDSEVDICIDCDGWEHKTWNSVKAFVGGDPDVCSIFEEVADLDRDYDKLASRWDVEFCDSCRILGKVKVKDTSPAGIMKALDKARL